MANLSAVRTALANQLNQYVSPNLNVLANPLDQINPPCGLVLPAKNVAKYGRTLGGPYKSLGGTQLAATDFNVDVLLFVSHATTTDRMQQTLDQWLGFEDDESVVSVPMAIEKDISLGGAVSWCIPVSCDSYGPIEYSGNSYFGARIHCEVSLE